MFADLPEDLGLPPLDPLWEALKRAQGDQAQTTLSDTERYIKDFPEFGSQQKGRDSLINGELASGRQINSVLTAQAEEAEKSILHASKFSQVGQEHLENSRIALKQFQEHKNSVREKTSEVANLLKKLRIALQEQQDQEDAARRQHDQLQANIKIALEGVGVSMIDDVTIRDLPYLSELPPKLKFVPSRNIDHCASRKDLNLPETHAFDLGVLLNSQEAATLADTLHPYKSTIDKDPRYRSNESALVYFPELTETLWRRMFFQKKDRFKFSNPDTEFGTQTWIPASLGKLFKITKVLSGTPSIGEPEGPWKKPKDTSKISLYTVIIFLNGLQDKTEAGLDGGHISVQSGGQSVEVAPYPGKAICVPHGTTLLERRVYRGIRYIATTNLWFKVLPLDSDPGPFAFNFGSRGHEICSDPQLIKSVIAYRFREGQDTPTLLQNQENEMKRKVKACRDREPVRNGLEKDQWCEDIWIKITDQLSFRGFLSIMNSSKDLNELCKSDCFWKARFLRAWTNQVDDQTVPNMTLKPGVSWYDRYKHQDFAYKNYAGTILDIGSCDTKLLCFRYAKGQGRRREIQSEKFSSLYSIKGKLWTAGAWPVLNKEAIILGAQHGGTPLQAAPPKHLNPIFQLLSHSSKKICLILSPGDKLPPKSGEGFESKDSKFSDFEIRYCEASVATLCAHNKKTGIVVSLGASKTWVEVVQDYHVRWTHVHESKDDPVEEKLKGLLEPFFAYYEQNQEVTRLEFCCIGGRFDKEAVAIFEALLFKQATNTPCVILSEVEDRFYAPLRGALFAPVRNRNAHVYLFNCHLIRAAFQPAEQPAAGFTFPLKPEKIQTQENLFEKTVPAVPTPLAATHNLRSFSIGDGAFKTESEIFPPTEGKYQPFFKKSVWAGEFRKVEPEDKPDIPGIPISFSFGPNARTTDSDPGPTSFPSFGTPAPATSNTSPNSFPAFGASTAPINFPSFGSPATPSTNPPATLAFPTFGTPPPQLAPTLNFPTFGTPFATPTTKPTAPDPSAGRKGHPSPDPKDIPPCVYGANCFRTNPKHHQEFSHPPKPDTQ